MCIALVNMYNEMHFRSIKTNKIPTASIVFCRVTRVMRPKRYIPTYLPEK